MKDRDQLDRERILALLSELLDRERILARLSELQFRAKAHADGLRYCMPDSAATEDASEMKLALRSLEADLRKMWGAS